MLRRDLQRSLERHPEAVAEIVARFGDDAYPHRRREIDAAMALIEAGLSALGCRREPLRVAPGAKGGD